jgi:hypothetical protein
MITRNALYSFIETLIENAADDTPLKDAESFRNLRESVDEATKIVRVEVFTGEHAMTDEDHRKELGVMFTVQCWVTPEDQEQTSIDSAVDDSFDMSRAIFEAIAGDTSLGNKVCDCYGSTFETGEANLGTLRRGVTYLDGTINRVS